MSSLTPFQANIKNILEQARSKVRSAVNSSIMVEAYWLILYTVCRELRWSHLRLIEGLS